LGFSRSFPLDTHGALRLFGISYAKYRMRSLHGLSSVGDAHQMERLSPGPTLIEQAYNAILGAICGGRISPGARLNQDELAATLHISRQPVGQALSVLKSQGFVRDNGRRGLIVAPLEREFFRSIYQLREALDAMAARLAADRRTPADAARGRKLVAEGRKALAGGDMEALVDADLRFHMWIYQVAGNPLLVETMRLYWNHLRRAMGEILRYPSSRATIWEEHQRILRAIVEGDPDAASAGALAHAHDAAERIIGSIPVAQPGDPIAAKKAR
jgi:DNA-binding GntR family transcriptional regulator